mgnify:CR=1 FL=1
MNNGSDMHKETGQGPFLMVLEDVHKSFEHHGNVIEVLRGVSLKVKEGESVAIVGASGVGKSTLLNIMGSLEPPTEGVVKFLGKNLYSLQEHELCRIRNQDIGFVFQFHHLLPELTALENVMMPALIARYAKQEARAMAKEVLEKVGLERRLSHQSGELSGGEQQRVAIARALVMKPKLILADEPTGNLDWFTGKEVAGLLMKLNEEEGISMVVATHNQSLAAQMSRKMEIVGGRVQ